MVSLLQFGMVLLRGANRLNGLCGANGYLLRSSGYSKCKTLTADLTESNDIESK